MNKISEIIVGFEPPRQAANGEAFIFLDRVGSEKLEFLRIAGFHGGHFRKRDNAFMGQVSVGGRLTSCQLHSVTLTNGDVIPVAVVPAPAADVVRRFTAPWRMSRDGRRRYERELGLHAMKKPAQWAKACLWKGEGAEEAGKRLREFWLRDGSCWSPSWDEARDHAAELIDFPALPVGDVEHSKGNPHRE